MLTTVLKTFEDRAPVADLKIASAALKELRYGFKVFAPYRETPKVTVFGSARTPADHPVSVQARSFGRRMADHGWMVITGAGSGVMGAAQEAAGEIERFYRVFHSHRYVGDSFAIRLRRPLAPAIVAEISLRFSDILKGPAEQVPGPLPGERGEFPDLPRLVLPFNRSGFSRLRQLVDFVNAS